MQWTVEKLVDTSTSRLVSIRIKRVPASCKDSRALANKISPVPLKTNI